MGYIVFRLPDYRDGSGSLKEQIACLLGVWLGYGVIDILFKQLSKTAGTGSNLLVMFALAGVLMAALLIMIFVAPDTNLAAFGAMKDIPADYSNVRDLGTQIYTTYLLPFELASVLLVLGMVAAIALVHRKSTRTKYMDPALQVRVNPNEGRMRLVSMPAEVQTPRTQPETETTEESQA